MSNELFLLILKIGEREYNKKVIFSNAESIIRGICERIIIKPNTKSLYEEYIKYREELKKQC